MKVRSGAALAAVLAVGILVSGLLSPYNQYLGVTILTYAVVAQAWNVISGYSGQLSLGVAAFLGVGGYATGLLMVHQGLGWIEGAVCGTVISGLLAVALGIPLLRLRGPYFAVGTLAATIALAAGGGLWTWAGAGSGFTLPPGQLPSSVGLLRAAVVAFVLAMAAVVFLRDSAFGLRVVAVRDSEQAAAGVGISTFRHRMGAFVLSGALTGLAGSLVAMQSITVDPGGMFSVNWTVNATLMVVVGGVATVGGPLIGVILIYYVLTQRLQSLQALSTVIEGALLVLIVRFAPGGLWPLLVRVSGTSWNLLRRIKARRTGTVAAQ